MPIPGPGTAISINTIATEFGGTAPHGLNEYYRGGGLVGNTPNNASIPTAGQIAIGDFYGTASRIIYTVNIGSNTYNYDVYANRGPAYQAGITDLTVTVPAAVTVGSTSTGTYAMSVPNAFSPTDTVTIVNSGVIQGMGGGGGRGAGVPGPATGGGTGGNALYVNRPTVITNNGTLAGGGGGGGGGTYWPGYKSYVGGGGGGGGAGFNGGGGGAGGPGPGGSGSPGGGGNSTSGGGGGGSPAPQVYGGPGGGRGANGSGTPGAGGGAAGYYLVGNAFVTWPAVGTRQGNVS